jgi:hypothetical protein
MQRQSDKQCHCPANSRLGRHHQTQHTASSTCKTDSRKPGAAAALEAISGSAIDTDAAAEIITPTPDREAERALTKRSISYPAAEVMRVSLGCTASTLLAGPPCSSLGPSYLPPIELPPPNSPFNSPRCSPALLLPASREGAVIRRFTAASTDPWAAPPRARGARVLSAQCYRRPPRRAVAAAAEGNSHQTAQWRRCRHPRPEIPEKDSCRSKDVSGTLQAGTASDSTREPRIRERS